MIGSSAFAQGLTVRDIQAHLEDLYGLKVSPDPDLSGPATADQAPVELAPVESTPVEAAWGNKYVSVAPAWRRAWGEVTPFFAVPPAVQKIIYTTNTIESLNRMRREKAVRSIREWFAAHNQFDIMFAERFNA